MKIIYVGRRYIGDLRECCFFNTETFEERHFLQEEAYIDTFIQNHTEYVKEKKATYD